MPGDVGQQLKTVLAQHKGIAVGGAAVVALGLYSWNKSKNGASSSTAGAVSYDPATGQPVGQASVDTSGTDMFNAIEPILAQLQDSVDQLGQTKTTPVTKPPTKSPVDGSPPHNPAKPIKPKPKPKPPPGRVTKPPGHPRPAPVRVTVKRGDTLWGIAKAHHTTWQKIWNANRGVIGKNPNLIKPGQRLTIPK